MISSALRKWWAGRHRTVFSLAIAMMAGVALLWLAYQFWRLLWQDVPVWPTSPTGAVDLKNTYQVVHAWFAGEPVYGELAWAVHPPASYPAFWLLLGWLPLAPARWLWGATTILALGWLVRVIVRESGAQTSLERAFVALMPLSIYAVGATIGNGQHGLHVLVLALAAVLLLRTQRATWRDDLLLAALILASLAKPTITVPFFWIIVFVPGRLRPAALVGGGYCALTVFAASFQQVGLWDLLARWTARASEFGTHSGEANLHIWLATLGLGQWRLASSALALAALGLWTYRHRRGDVWLLLGVTAIVARLWTYHQWYDDLLILLPMVALFRVAKQDASSGAAGVVAGGLLAAAVAAMLAPGARYLLPAPWNGLCEAGQVAIWLAMLAFLICRAARDGPGGHGSAPAPRPTGQSSDTTGV